ncbi:MAG: EAL domain-containing protein [Bryobacteraceae bacterium]
MESAQITLASIGDGVACSDSKGNLTFLNRVAEELTCWSHQEALGRPMSEVLEFRDASSHEIAFGQDYPLHLPSNAVLVRRDGVEISVEGSVSPVHHGKGQPEGAVIIFRDVTIMRAMILQIAHAAQHDFLTDLPNRMLLVERINQVIFSARRHSRRVGLLFVDLDGFKNINDTLGHSAGDRLLQSISSRLVEGVRGSDTVSRQGGDEFIVLLSELAHDEDAALTARRLLRAIAQQHRIEEHEVYITASIGISVYPDDGLDAETLITNADAAMYDAKKEGPQGFQFFRPAMNLRVMERQSIEEDLTHAAERHELSLHYQPRVNLKSGEITGAEALLRWTHPTRGQVSPAEFIPVAEKCGLILPIGRWVLHEACRQIRAWADAGLFLSTISVNISPVEFRHESFLEGVRSILSETGLHPGALELELTETALMKDPDTTEPTLKTLRELGVQVAVDGFGTGYSSLSNLRTFCIDCLKIDQAFVRQIDASIADPTVVNTIIAMGRSLNLRVIAEGVETREELEFLRNQECEEAQGYYFSRAVASTAVRRETFARDSGDRSSTFPRMNASRKDYTSSGRVVFGDHSPAPPIPAAETGNGLL